MSILPVYRDNPTIDNQRRSVAWTAVVTLNLSLEYLPYLAVPLLVPNRNPNPKQRETRLYPQC